VANPEWNLEAAERLESESDVDVGTDPWTTP
jgi:hypothetical protein